MILTVGTLREICQNIEKEYGSDKEVIIQMLAEISGEVIYGSYCQSFIVNNKGQLFLRDLADKDASEIKEHVSCNHIKVHASYILASNPPQHPWICSICGTKGTDIGSSCEYSPDYTEIEKRFSKV